MQNSVQLEMNKPLKYPSNDVSVRWPSFQSSNLSSMPIIMDAQLNQNMSLSKFSDSESEKSHVPRNLEKLCSFNNFSEKESHKSFLFKYEKIWYSKIISSNLMNISVLILTIYLPYYYYINFKESDPLYFPVLIFLLLIELFTLFIRLICQFLKKKSFSLSLLSVIILLNFTLCLKINNIFLYTNLYFLLFSRSLKIIQKMLSLIVFINYSQISIMKSIILVLFQIHYFACVWGVEFKNIYQNDFTYSDYLYKSFLLLFFQIDQQENQNKLLIVTHLIANLIIIFFIIKIFQQSQQKLLKHQITLNTYKLFLKSNILKLKFKFLLYHYSELFLEVENELNPNKERKKNSIIEYIKMNLIKQELKHFNFLSEMTLREISKKGVLGLNFDHKQFSEKINGLYIILTGKMSIEFMGLRLDFDNRNIINLCLIQMLNDQSIGKIRLEQIDTNGILYFYINQQQFINSLQKQIEKEKYQMVKDDIIFNNNTKELNIQCYFCKMFHPTFNCASLNIKRRFTYDKTYQERISTFTRKNKKIKTGIYQQITHQGTSNNNIIDISSDSFEAFSDYSSEKLSISNQQYYYDQIGKQNSTTQIHKEIFQIDMISDKISDPIISSTLIKHLQVPGALIKNLSGSNQVGFQDLDQIVEIDRVWEYQYYSVRYNISNVLKIINKQKSQKIYN